MDLDMDSNVGWRAGVLGWHRVPAPVQAAVGVLVVAVLLALGASNIAIKARWHEVEDGVLWKAQPEGVVAAEVAEHSPAQAAGVRVGDILQAINSQPIDAPGDVIPFFAKGRGDTPLTYTVLRLKTPQLVDLRLGLIPQGNLPLYFVLASIGIFGLLVAASVRLRRPGDPATLHFFCLAVAFFGTFTLSPLLRFDPLDWVFYWGDEVATLMLAPLLFHFALVFPDRPRAWVRSTVGSRLVPLVYVPAVILCGVRIIAIARGHFDPARYAALIGWLDRLDPLYVAAWLLAAAIVLLRGFRTIRSVTARRQLRWIVWGTVVGAVPFAVGYAVPWALGADPSVKMQLTAIPLSLLPLAFASALVRYRLMDVEVIIKRVLVWAAAISAIVAIYAVLLRVAGAIFLEDRSQHNSVIAVLATLVVVLLARPVKNAIQNTFDRAFYRDRYDYRRALLGFARDLNADLDLYRLGERLVVRVMETFLVERMALMLLDDQAGSFAAIRAMGFSEPVPALGRTSAVGARLLAGQPIAFEDPSLARSIGTEETEFWREHEINCLVPCVSKEGTIAVLALGRKASGESLNSEDLALLMAVAAQVATALENGRLYRALRIKAEEVDRMRLFNESILESLDAGLVVVDVHDRVILWNRALERFYGVERADAIGRPLADLFERRFVEGMEAARRDVPAGASLYRVSLGARVAGSDTRLLVNVTTMPLQASGGEAGPAGTIIIIDDVTSRVQLEEQLQISEKMASIGVLAAGVAHEVNTPLTGISSFTQMLLQKADPDSPDTKVLEKIERQTFRAAKIVNGLLNLARPSAQAAVERGPVDVNAVINDVLSLVEHQLKAASIQVRREMTSPAPIIYGYEFKLQQVFLNLFINARDAMPKGGWLAIATRVEADRVFVEIADTGSGIPREHLSRIYDPFFTTKAIGLGIGLGLSITYGIVREHDGSIDCESAVGVGTRFILSFPLASAALPRPGRVAQ
jgi:two-component system NtrC family sensor kinase